MNKEELAISILQHPKVGDLELDLDENNEDDFIYLITCYNEIDLQEFLDELNS